MVNETLISALTEMVNQVISEMPAYFLVSLRIKPTQNIKVFLDGDQGISIETCVQVNRRLYALIEESGLFPAGDFSLEVSSPGVDEPLKFKRQYHRNTGRDVTITFHDQTTRSGTLLAVTDNDILLEQTTGKGKKKETHQELIPFDKIASTVVQIKFK